MIINSTIWLINNNFFLQQIYVRSKQITPICMCYYECLPLNLHKKGWMSTHYHLNVISALHSIIASIQFRVKYREKKRSMASKEKSYSVVFLWVQFSFRLPYRRRTYIVDWICAFTCLHMELYLRFQMSSFIKAFQSKRCFSAIYSTSASRRVQLDHCLASFCSLVDRWLLLSIDIPN